MDYSGDKHKYWMAKDGKDVVSKISEFHGSWTVWGSHPIAQAWVRNTIAYYSTVLDPASWDTSLVFEGKQGELVKMSVPQARSLIRQLVTLVTKQSLNFNCIARITGSDVVNEVRLGNALASHIVNAQDLNTKAKTLCEQTLITGMAFLKACWRTDKGKPFSVGDSGNVIYDGDLEISNHTIFDVFFDYGVPYWNDLDWVEVRTMKNRWSLLAQFPDLETEILQLPTIKDWRGPHASQYRTVSEDDLVYTYEVYHKPCPAIPEGRFLVYSSKDTIFHDGPNEYDGIPVEPMLPAPIMGTGFGYPAISDLLPAQEMLDHSFSAIATNQAAFAVQSVTVPRGAGINVQDIGGMNFISFTPQNVPGGGKPEPMQLTQSSPETFKFIDLCLGNMQQLSNISPAMRGNPPPGVTSGVAIATLSNNSLEFISDYAQPWQNCIRKTMMHAINSYRKFAKIPKMVRIVGKNFQSSEKSFIGTDLDPIIDVELTVTNPLLQTLAGRTDIAEKLVQSGLIKDVKSYISVLEGAPLKELYEVELSEEDLIRSENEQMLDGKQVLALSTDDHPEHVLKHKSLLNDPEVRKNNARAKLVLDHILEHKMLNETVDPGLKAMLRTGQEGPPPAPPAGPPQSQSTMPGMPQTQGAKPAEDMLQRGLQ